MKEKTKLNWRHLDNAAKIFPATSNRRDERVFRFSCELKETVDPDILQNALDNTMKRFPMFCCVLRKGFFWYYFEERDIRAMVEEENKPPCSRIYERDQKNLLFRVSYYKKRINFEVFHALTDGNGAVGFLKMLVEYYLKEKHPKEVTDPVNSYDATYMEKAEDSFKQYYEKTDKTIKIPKFKSAQLPFQKKEAGFMQIIEGCMSVKSVAALAKEHQTTITVFLTAVYMLAISKELTPRQKNKTVSVMVPVNLRHYFPSDSASNFFGWIDVGYDFAKQSSELDDIVDAVTEFFQTELKKERLAVRANELVKMEENVLIKMLPLDIKNIGMRIGAATSVGGCTVVFSNIGRITMPKQCIPYIRLFDVFITTPKMQLCMCSFEDNLVLSFTSSYDNSVVERNFFRILTSLGVEIDISAREE